MLGPFVCCRFRFVLEAREPLWLGAFAAATLRGGFGHAFKRAVCLWQPGDCQRCLLKERCVYPYVFETAPPPGSEKLRGQDQVPRPYVIEAADDGDRSRTYAPGERFDFGLVLVGRAIADFPYFLFAFHTLSEAGLGQGRGQFDVAEVHAEGTFGSTCVFTAATGLRHGEGERVAADDLAADPRAEPAGRRLTLEFLTPVRIRNDGAVRARLTFQDVVRALLRRLSSLCYFHCGGELDVDFRGLIDRAADIRTTEDRLRWHDQSRVSGRQGQAIDMGGLVGRITFEAADAEEWRPYLPLLLAGEWAHVGKGAVMGLGRYRLCFN